MNLLAGPLAANTNLPVVELHLDTEDRLGTVIVKITERLFSDDIVSLLIEIAGRDPGSEVTTYSDAVFGNESGVELIQSWAGGNEECSHPLGPSVRPGGEPPCARPSDVIHALTAITRLPEGARRMAAVPTAGWGLFIPWT